MRMQKNEKKEQPPKKLSEIDPKMMARIQSLRLMDDDFMTIVFSGDNKLTEFLLRILLDRTDLTVKSCLTQKEKHNIFGRSVRLDIMHDFRESDASKMHYSEIAERVRFHKQEEQEVNTVCRAFEEYGNERATVAVAERNIEIAKKLLLKNKLSLEEIAETAELPLEQVQSLAEQIQSNNEK